MSRNWTQRYPHVLYRVWNYTVNQNTYIPLYIHIFITFTIVGWFSKFLHCQLSVRIWQWKNLENQPTFAKKLWINVQRFDSQCTFTCIYLSAVILLSLLLRSLLFSAHLIYICFSRCHPSLLCLKQKLSLLAAGTTTCMSVLLWCTVLTV